MRRRLPWLVALAALLAGTQVAHALAYWLLYPQASLRSTVLTATGHGYFAWLPLALGAAGAVALVGSGAAVLDTARGRRVRELRPAAFALLPPFAFALQEVLELSLHTGTFGWHAFAEPTFLPGLALQLPFALLAYIAARLLLRVAVRLGRALARARVAAATPLHHVSSPSAAGLQPGCRFAPRGPPRAVAI